MKLAGTDIEIPSLGLGTWAWGDKSTWGMGGYDTTYGLDTIRAAYDRSVAAGVTLLDTAEVYGKGESERIIGRLLQEDPANRNRIIVATKFMPFPWRIPMARALRQSLLASLERLKLDFVHLYQIHGPISLRSHATLADALAGAHADGLIKAVGVSNYSERETRGMHVALAERGVALATNQIEFSLLRRLPESGGLLAACKELGVTILAYSPLAQGRLTGKYSAVNPPPGQRNFSAYPMAEIEPLLGELRRIATQAAKTPSQVALNWLICKGTVPIPGAKNGQQAEQNAGALGWQLADADVRALDAASKPGLRSLSLRVWQHG